MRIPDESIARYRTLKSRMDAGERIDKDDFAFCRAYQRAMRVVGRADARRWRCGNNVVQQAKYGPMIARGV